MDGRPILLAYLDCPFVNFSRIIIGNGNAGAVQGQPTAGNTVKLAQDVYRLHGASSENMEVGSNLKVASSQEKILFFSY